MMKFVNLTPHPITIQRPYGDRLTLEPALPPARVEPLPDEYEQWVDDICVVRRSPAGGRIVGLPDEQPDTLYIVSLAVLSALHASGSTRQDVVAPGTGPTDQPIREGGQIVAVTRLVGLPPGVMSNGS
jgi:hypothetical protein